MRLLRRFTPPLLVLLVAACGSEPTVAPSQVPARLTHAGSSALVPLDPFGIGAKLPGSRGCEAAAYREFDFWVGKWDAYGYPTGPLSGTNIVTSEVGGCAVLENWKSVFGGRGRSLNAYDASTGHWSQMWVGGGGCPFANIFVEGSLEGGTMRMTGRREQPLGFLISQCPGAGSVVFAHADRIHWTALPNGDVVQQSVFANNADPLPTITPPPNGLGLRYVAVPTVTSVSAPEGPSFCQFRPQARQFDFMVGTWNVHQGSGEGAQGAATFSKDITNCLLEERFEGPGGYEGLSFNTYDAFTQQWYRTYVDNDGQRILMTGKLQANGTMVLIGTKAGAGGRSVEVRITWTSVSPARFEQRWDYSTDRGATWRIGQEIVYTRAE
jgi:hypothetical protein